MKFPSWQEWLFIVLGTAALFALLYLPPSGSAVLATSNPLPSTAFLSTSLPAASDPFFVLPVRVFERAWSPDSIVRINANPLMLLIAAVDGDTVVYDLDDLVRPGTRDSEYRRRSAKINNRSRFVPVIVALEAASASFSIEGDRIVLADGNFVMLESHEGSSGDLGFALEVYSRATGQDLLDGRRIAGVGSMELGGGVRPVAGFELKVRSAEQHGINVVLAANSYDAPSQVEVVTVENFSEALAYLEQS